MVAGQLSSIKLKTVSKTLGVVVAVFLYVGSAQATSAPDLGAILHTERLLQAGDNGQGVRVGIISNGASNYARLSDQRLLPTDVKFFGGDINQGDEGDWMLQVVHQIAPLAQLAFCPGGSPSQTVGCAHELITTFHADIVVDDINPQPIFYFPTPKATGLADLAREHPNVLFFTGAGNNGGGYYEGNWTPWSLTINGTRYAAQDFGHSLGSDNDPYDTFLLPLGGEAMIMLGTNVNPNGSPSQCAEGNPKVTLALLDEQNVFLDSVSSRCPVLQLHYRNRSISSQNIRIAVLLPSNIRPQHFDLKLVANRIGDGVSSLALRYRTPGSAGNSATTPGLIAVAAVDPYTGWNGHFLDEAFANSGPQCLEYASSGYNQWSRLSTPLCIKQPAFVVPDRAMVAMRSLSGDHMVPFIGDSAAGPAAAGAAALLLSARVPAAKIVGLFERNAIPQVETPGWNARYGYGLIDADASAVAAGVLPPDRPIIYPPSLNRANPFHQTQSFLQDRQLTLNAQHGDAQALTTLRSLALAGHADAQAWLATYSHGTGDNTAAAQWALAAANQGQPIAQGFLGTLYNRGWGVPMDPRAAQAWWLRAARAGVVSALYNMGTTVAQGRGALADPMLGYALMRAAAERGMQFPPMAQAIEAVRSELSAQQIQSAETLAARFATDSSVIPDP